MAIRGGGDPTLKPWLSSRCAEWARRPELRVDAHDCIMVAILADQPNTRLWRELRAPHGELRLELSSLGPLPGKLDRPT